MKTSRYVYSLLTLVLLLACLRFAVSAGAARPAEDRDPQWTYTPIRLAAYTFDPLDVAAQPPVAPELRLSDAARDAEGYYLLQFQGPIQQEWVDTVVRSGVALYDYVPEFTFIAKLDDAARKRVERLPFVRWLGVYQPAFRVQPDLAVAAGVSDIRSISSYGDTGASLHRQIDGGNIALLIRVFPDEDADAVSEAIRNLGGVVHEVQQTAWRGTIRADLPMDQLTAIAQMHGVQWIEPAPRWELTNNVAADVMHVREIWDGLGFRGEGQIVAVTDTGLDQGAMAPGVLHDDFEDGNGNSRVVALFDLVGDGAEDVNNGHGTHVAGSVLGNGIRSGSDPFHHVYPGTAFPGMAPEANLVFQAIEDNETGLLTGLPSDLYPLFAQTYDVGARVHSNSWGAALDGQYTSGDQDVDEFVWDHPNMVVLYAAGNAGEDANGDGHVDPTSIDTPGAAKNAITVGASENLRPSGSVPTLTIDYAWGQAWPQDFPVNPLAADHVSDNPFGMAAFSGRGPTRDGRTKPDIVAPGTNIISTRSSLAAGSGWGVVDGDYMFMGGTSMATPLVAGASALVREFYTRTYAWDPSAALVKATLVNGAQELSPGQYGRPLSQWQRQTVDTWDN
ncbi:MAG: S8 family serine peptidase, partial [Anaerolineae bacterium]